MSGLAIGTTTSAAEEIQKVAPWARVVNMSLIALISSGSKRRDENGKK
jgi:hypothetical protein